MPTSSVTLIVYNGGRIAVWLVLALLGIAVVYANAIVALNWNAIHV